MSYDSGIPAVATLKPEATKLEIFYDKAIVFKQQSGELAGKTVVFMKENNAILMKVFTVAGGLFLLYENKWAVAGGALVGVVTPDFLSVTKDKLEQLCKETPAFFVTTLGIGAILWDNAPWLSLGFVGGVIAANQARTIKAEKKVELPGESTFNHYWNKVWGSPEKIKKTE